MKGIFITFEGPDGSGKSTQLQLLEEYIRYKQLSYIRTREPGGTLISDLIRNIILNPDHQEMVPETEALLYAASRAQHVHEKILPALKEGKIVLSDRYIDASIAYQGFGLGLGEELIHKINHMATKGLLPTRTYLIDVPPQVGRSRMNNRKQQEFEQELDRIEQKELQYHTKVRQGFQHLMEHHQRILTLDGCQEIHTIQERIRNDFDQFITSMGL